MRTVAAWLGLALGACLCGAPAAHAQRALAGAVPRVEQPAPLLTLRPSPELHALATEAAEVLELRTGQRVEVGEPPPPGLMEAVPAGHVALALDAGAIVIVMGAAGGGTHDTLVRLGNERGHEMDARAVALAVEALRDLAMELSAERGNLALAPDAAADRAPRQALGPEPAPLKPGERPTPGVAPQPEAGEALGGAPRDGAAWVEGGFLSDVEPMLFVRAYGGASTASPGPRVGLGTGVGLCVLRHCLTVFAEVPLHVGPAEPFDTRYQYPTFGSSFYSRPFTYAGFTPGASVGFVTRVGYFEQDMGLPDQGLQTDLGARGTLELGYALWGGLELTTEIGADLILDRLHLQSGGKVADRGDRLTPWAQAAVRYAL